MMPFEDAADAARTAARAYTVTEVLALLQPREYYDSKPHKAPEDLERVRKALETLRSRPDGDVREAIADLIYEVAGLAYWGGRQVANEVADRVLATFDVHADPKGGCACHPVAQDAGGGYTERLLEYEPDCPVHSHHLYDPRTGQWIIDPREDPAGDELARLSHAARPGPWLAYETMQADNFIVEESQGLLRGPGPVMGPSYDKSTTEHVVALVNRHRAELAARKTRA